MKPFEKLFAFGFLTIVHPTGHTDRITIEDLEAQIININDTIKDLKSDRKEFINDLAKISSKSRIKRFLIKRKVVKNGKTKTQEKQP